MATAAFPQAATAGALQAGSAGQVAPSPDITFRVITAKAAASRTVAQVAVETAVAGTEAGAEVAATSEGTVLIYRKSLSLEPF